MISNAFLALRHWWANRPKRVPGPSWFDLKEEGDKPDVYWKMHYPLKLTQHYGDISYVSAFKQYFITGPEGFAHILKTRNRNYQRAPFFYKARMQPLFGKSILVTEGPYWKHRRKIALPFYQTSALKDHAPVILEETQNLILKWKNKLPTKINILEEMNHLTLTIAFKLFCNTLPEDKVLKQIHDALHFGNLYSSQSLFIHPLKPTFNNVRFFWHLKRLDTILLQIIDARSENPTSKIDLLNHLLSATDPENPSVPLTRDQILAEFKSHLITGHETTACALSWAWYLLDQYPSYRAALETELETVLQGRPPTLDDVPHLKWTKAILLETFRLYPPSWCITRVNLEADTIAGYPIPANSVFVLHLFALHRNPQYWPEPHQFKPERFLTEDPQRHPFAYLPFSAGPHTCIASHLGTLEATLILAQLAQHFQFKTASLKKVKLEPCISLRPEGGIKMYPTRL